MGDDDSDVCVDGLERLCVDESLMLLIMVCFTRNWTQFLLPRLLSQSPSQTHLQSLSATQSRSSRQLLSS